MKSRELQRFLATATGRIESEIDQRCRELRKAGMISHGARGNGAPNMTMAEALLHVLALVARRPADAGTVVERLLACLPITPPDNSESLHRVFRGVDEGLRNNLHINMTLAASGALGALGFEIISFEFHEDGHSAWMNLDSPTAKGLRFMFSSTPDLVEKEIDGSVDQLRRHEAAIGGTRLVISADMLRVLGDRIEADEAASHVLQHIPEVSNGATSARSQS